MTTFFIDLWHDLREKRLWPVAVGLLAAIVAVPVVLFKPASDAAPPAATTPKTGGADTLPVVTVVSGPTMGSRLEAFSANEKNPFKPMKDLAQAPGTASKTATGGSTSTSGSGSGSSSGGSTLANPNGTGTGTGSSSTGGSSPSGGTPSSGTPSSSTPSIKWFHYTADFTFGKTGKKPKTHKSVGNFTLLPDETTPAIVFLGIDGDHKSAMFFISDPGFTAQGEGSCNAKGAACRFVTLRLKDTADEETFSAVDGSVSYDLKLLGIKREELGTGSAPAASTTPPTSGKALAATGSGVATTTQAAQSVLPAMFAAGPVVALEQK
jgi:hypothetical protein